MKRKRGRPRKEKVKILSMRLLKYSPGDDGGVFHMYYQEYITSKVRGNEGIVLPRDAVFSGIGINITKYEHHKEILSMMYGVKFKEMEIK